MTSPLIESVRDIPTIPVNVRSSGFPFDDRDFDRDRSHSSFRSQLDDLAKRHPEFAEHLNIGEGFPFRSHTLGRHRRGSDTEKPSGSQDAEFRRHPHDRPFSRFDHFPFRQYFEDDVPDFSDAGYRIPERRPYYAHPNQEPVDESQQQQYPQQTSQPKSPQPTPSGNAEKPPQIPQNREGARKQNIQQSNTVDLGQRQEPVDETRGQRSMSAPPENRSTGQRFVSSINIPIQRPSGGGGDMGAKTSTQAQESVQQQTNKPNERVIPIHVEGRDEPIIPKNIHTTFTSPPPQPQPQSERVFGRNPSHFTQFLNKGEPHGMTPEEHYKQQQQQYQKQQQQNFQQQEPQDQSQSHEVPQAQPQFQPPPPSKAAQLDQIQNIQKDVNELMNQVERFDGKPRDKQYLYLDEMLTRNLIKLDNIETEGKDNIRQARKEAIKCIEGCIGILEAKANANLAAETHKDLQQMDIEASVSNKPHEEQIIQSAPTETPLEESGTTSESMKDQSQVQSGCLEVSGVTRTGSITNVTPMEVTTGDECKKEVPASISETQPQENKTETELPPETQQKPEENTETEPKKEDEKDKQEDDENSRTEENLVTFDTDVTSQNLESESAPQEDKKEKKKGKKKEKTDKK